MVNIGRWYESLRIVKWIRVLQRVVDTFDTNNEHLNSKIAYAKDIANNAEKIIRDRTDVSAGIDINMRAPNQIIVVGRYKGLDYVEVFSILDSGVDEIVDHLRSLQRYAGMDKIDAPISLRAVVRQQVARK